MVKQINPIFEWDPETGVATCIIIDGDQTYVGVATCHPDDRDMMGEKTGCTIAEFRAELDYLRSIRDNKIKPTLNAYKTLYYSINQSKRFNPDSYEAHMLGKKIGDAEADLEMINEMIATNRTELYFYMKDKAEVFQKIRKNRSQDKSE